MLCLLVRDVGEERGKMLKQEVVRVAASPSASATRIDNGPRTRQGYTRACKSSLSAPDTSTVRTTQFTNAPSGKSGL